MHAIFLSLYHNGAVHIPTVFPKGDKVGKYYKLLFRFSHTHKTTAEVP